MGIIYLILGAVCTIYHDYDKLKWNIVKSWHNYALVLLCVLLCYIHSTKWTRHFIRLLQNVWPTFRLEYGSPRRLYILVKTKKYAKKKITTTYATPYLSDIFDFLTKRNFDSSFIYTWKNQVAAKRKRNALWLIRINLFLFLSKQCVEMCLYKDSQTCQPSNEETKTSIESQLYKTDFLVSPKTLPRKRSNN